MGFPALRRSGLRHSLAGSPIGPAESSSFSYGRLLLLPLLPTPPRGDAVTVRYRPEWACLKGTSTLPARHPHGRTGAPLIRNYRLGDRLETVKVSSKSEGSEAGKETSGLGLLVSGAEVLRPEITIGGAVLEHVIGGGEDGGGDGDDRLLGAAPRPEADELGMQVGGFGFRCRPGALDERGLSATARLCGCVSSVACRRSRRFAGRGRPRRPGGRRSGSGSCRGRSRRR